uniref:Uncharacterized protein n=1 Tax=Arundo donax TaxID=35708 RepID=A0A0A8Y2V8_ARUDO
MGIKHAARMPHTGSHTLGFRSPIYGVLAR